MLAPTARRRFALVSAAVFTLLVLTVNAASAGGPQPDPPAFGMFGITQFQRAHLHVAVPAVQSIARGKLPPGPCHAELMIIDEAGMVVKSWTAEIKPGQTFTAVFDPRGDIILTDAAVSSNDDPEPSIQRHQLRFAINTLPPPTGEMDGCAWLQATTQVDNNDGHAPTLTLSPFKAGLFNPVNNQTPARGNRGTWHGLGPIAIGFGHTARLNAVNVGTGDGIQCQVSWTLLNGDGRVLNKGTAMIQGGQAIHADFAHTDPSVGLAQIRGEVTVTEGNSGHCPSDTTIGTLEGFDSNVGHSHSIVPAQLIVPAVQ